MTSIVPKRAVWLGLVLALAACTNSEVVAPNNGRVLAQVVVDPVAGAEFANATATVAAIRVRPVGPGNSLLGEPILLMQAPVTVDVTQPGPVLLTNIALRAGTYRLEDVVFTSFQLAKTGTPGNELYSCTDGQVTTVRAGATVQVQLVPPVFFTVTYAQTTQLTVTLDAASLIPMLAANGQVACDLCPTPPCGQTTPVPAPLTVDQVSSAVRVDIE